MAYRRTAGPATERFFPNAVRPLRDAAFGETNPMMTASRPPAWIVLACVLVGLPACKKSNSVAMSDAAYPEEAYAGGYDEDYGGEADYAAVSEAEPAPAPASMDVERERSFGSQRATRRERRAMKNMPEVASPPPAPKEPAGATTTAEPDAAKPKPTGDEQPDADEGRHIIYTAGMRIAVFNLEDAVATAEALPERYGGYVQSMNNNQVVLRIPSRNLRTVMSSLAGYGNVEQRWLNSQDVTSEYTDLESRLKALEKTHAQLLDLLDKARTVEEALEVRAALDRVAAELEVLKGRLRQLDNMTTYSTLTLDFYERGPHTPTPSSNDPFPWVDSLGVENTEWK